MDRDDILRTYATKDGFGIEIAPWFRPLVAKRDGYNVKTLDYMDRESLIIAAQKANVGYMAGHIEDVDIVGNANDIGTIVHGDGDDRLFDYIISSHNFEHIPNPVKFLQGAASLLKKGGHLSMAIPDKRCCFDFFRPVSTTADFIAAFMEDRQKPAFSQYFEQLSMSASYLVTGKYTYGRLLGQSVENFHPDERLKKAYALWSKSIAEPDGDYIDAHCWTFTPASLEIIMRDLGHLGLIDFRIVNVEKSVTDEILIHLEKHPDDDDPQFFPLRKILLRRMMHECAVDIDGAWA